MVAGLAMLILAVAAVVCVLLTDAITGSRDTRGDVHRDDGPRIPLPRA
ncbi:hypothetical protein EV193_105294 [Herbihabitans rhizosphaerae]|uniref:Uncharacterized protein n=1 Tax=Herbihabitans rhizosphaerae TaxID=1872711 RepID=A0A4Q7KN38_9PSEU|nr:hypothetical protein EV193_105294 [Herbihabitans rhizosphaerae]